MGNPNCKPLSAPDFANMPDVGMGGVFTIPGRCAPAGSVASFISCPDNGEFSAVGESENCYYDSKYPGSEIGCGSGCSNEGDCAIIGKRLACKRVAYLADPTECCITGAKTIGNKTCDPRFAGVNQHSCNVPVQNFCGIGNNFFDIQQCQEWCKYNPELCDTILVDSCRKPENREREECSCILAADAYRQANLDITLPPQCVDARCVGPKVLKTFSQINTDCQIVNCSMTRTQFDIDNSKVIGGIHMTQNCSAQITADPAPVSDVSGGGNVNPGQQQTNKNPTKPVPAVLPNITTQNAVIYGGIAVAGLIILIIILVLIRLILTKPKQV